MSGWGASWRILRKHQSLASQRLHPRISQQASPITVLLVFFLACILLYVYADMVISNLATIIISGIYIPKTLPRPKLPNRCFAGHFCEAAIAEAGALPYLAELLKDPKAQVTAAGALRNLAAQNVANQEKMSFLFVCFKHVLTGFFR